MEKANKLIAGNWKLYFSQDYRKLLSDLIAGYDSIICGRDDKVLKPEMVVFPPAIYLTEFDSYIRSKSSALKLGIQYFDNCDYGAQTGSINPAILSSNSNMFALAGHSEVRARLKEDDSLVAAKAVGAIKHGISVIVCFGEDIDQKKQAVKLARRQVSLVLNSLDLDNFIAEKICFAYEPVWSIGTGNIPENEEIQEVLAAVKSEITDILGFDFAFKIRCLYGGSVTEENALQLSSISESDGFLVGSASLDSKRFLEIASKLHMS